jgi:hypothetical protein
MLNSGTGIMNMVFIFILIIILGLESSEGKTWLFDSLAERYNEGIVIIEASYLRRFGKFIKYSKNRRQVCNFC